MRFLAAVVFALSIGACFAQDDKDPLLSPYDPHGAHQTSGIKGKAFFVPVGDDLGLGAMLGFEHGFLRRHTLGADVSIYREAGRYDAFTDTMGVEHPDGGRRWKESRAVLLNYRYYLDFRALREWRWAPYIGAFGRYSEVNGEGDPQYTSHNVEFHETHRSIGVLVGVLRRFDGCKHLGWDLNIGFFRKMKDMVYYDLKNGVLVPTSTTEELYGPRMDVNLYWMIFRERSR